jgi:hypothetical protein
MTQCAELTVGSKTVCRIAGNEQAERSESGNQRIYPVAIAIGCHSLCADQRLLRRGTRVTKRSDKKLGAGEKQRRKYN